MNASTRLNKLESKKLKVADSNAKQSLEKHLQKIADRSPTLTSAEQQESQEWLATEWPKHLDRIRNNAV